MRMDNFLKLIISLTIFAIIAGCSGRPIILSEHNKHIKLEDVDLTRGKTVSGSASGFQLLLLIPISINDRHERAFQVVRGQAGSDYITDVKIKDSWTYALVGTVYKTTIEATAFPRKTE